MSVLALLAQQPVDVGPALPCCCGGYLLIFLGGGLLSLLATAFWVWMLVEAIIYETDEGNTRLMWVLIIVLTNLLGAILYLVIRRGDRKRELGQ